jgi:ABC-type Fe3+/spermidine/putrescine transport system ATPase subunit
VTHDQEEALGMSSKVALINEGKLIQVDSPAKIYQNPQSDFVALFFGRSNSFRGVIKDITEHEMIFSTDNEEKLTLPKLSGFRQGQRVVVFVRSENIRVSEEKKAENSLFGQIISAIYLGSSMEYICKIGESRIIAKLQAGIKDELLPVNKTVWIGFNKEDCLIFPEEGF